MILSSQGSPSIQNPQSAPISTPAALFGDLIFDLAHHCIRDPEIADELTRETLASARKQAKNQTPDRYQRLWLLKLFWLNLSDHLKIHREAHPNEFALDMTPTHSERVAAFDAFFLRLDASDRFALSTTFSYQLETSEVATALQISEGGLHLRLERALRVLEEWLWDLPQSELNSTSDAQLSCFEFRPDLVIPLISDARSSSVAASSHFKSCAECKARLEHYRDIVSILKKSPQKKLPKEFFSKKIEPAKNTQNQLSHWGHLIQSLWQQMPWFLRTTIEGASIVLVVLLGVSVGPRLRHIYERDLDQTFAEFTEAFFKRSSSNDKNSVALTRGRSGSAEDLANGATSRADDFLDDAAQESQDGQDNSDESEGSDGDSTSNEDNGAASEGAPSDVRSKNTSTMSDELVVGSGEIWRFNLKTDSPRDFRTQIVDLLLDLNLPKNTPGIGGTEAPGGIQFDLIVSQDLVVTIKNRLEKLAPTPPAGASQKSPLSETFTWYKNKSRRPIPGGKSRVVIWLSQV